MKILLVEDDRYTASTLAEALTAHHYIVNSATDGQTGWELAQAYDYDLILLDVMLPRMDGISLCRQLRRNGYKMPILLLTAKNSTTDRVMGLDAGADDYVVKPFELSELLARMRALMRRGSVILPKLLTWENLQLNPDTSEVIYGGKLLHLTPREYGLLELLLRNPQRIFRRNAILDRVWPLGEFPGEDAVTTQIKGLRQKLKAAGMTTDLIETLYGLGYRLREAPEQGSRGAYRCASSSEALSSRRDVVASHSPIVPERSEAKAKVMALVAQMWEDFQENLREQIELFEQALAALRSRTLDSPLRQKAEAEAHRLIGSLGCFGLPFGSEVAREIEQLLQQHAVLGQGEVLRLEELVELLKQTVQRGSREQGAGSRERGEDALLPNRIQAPSFSHGEDRSARLLVIDDDVLLTEQIKVEAIAWGLQVEVATDLTAARSAIASLPPDVILLDLTFPNPTENGLNLLAEVASQIRSIPVVVLTERNQLTEKVTVARLGGRACLHKPVSSKQVLLAVTQALSPANAVDAKVMVVDDDRHLLGILSALLPNWGFQVITLEDPQQFWEVLEASVPNLLILDVEMPSFSGLDLCQVVRNDPCWSWIPILFLSAHTDVQTVRRVFTVGADDYVSKPIVEPELVARILNRLERVEMQCRLEEAIASSGAAKT